MAEDVPPDVNAVLVQLFEEGAQALEDGNDDTCLQSVESAESVVTNKLPEGELRGQLRHGCRRVRELLTSDDQDREAAAEFLSAMQRRLPEES